MPLEPALFILFGTTGDLARKKLYPALYALHTAGHLAPQTAILGIGRRDWDDTKYRETIVASLRAAEPAAHLDDTTFTSRFFYHRMDMAVQEDYTGLWDHMIRLETERQLGGNRINFLATAPELFPVASRQIGLNRHPGQGSFRRLMIEKPFGQDLASARSFNESLREVFPEHEIYRIDHYLGKAMLQNILVLRFANQLFEPGWNRQHIDHIQVSVTEPFGIEQRGGYYDNSGALRDMVQSHLLQLLALLTMDRPGGDTPEEIRNAKVSLLRALRPFDADRAMTEVVLGQYDGDSRTRGYLDEANIPAGSRTETFAALRLSIDNDRWRDVPVYMRTGKRLNRYDAKIVIVFKHQPYPGSAKESGRNTLIIRIQPQEGIDLRFNIKQPGMTTAITQAHMDICQSCDPVVPSPQAYEKLLYDAWSGDLSLFTRWDEIEATWTLVDSIRQWRKQLPLFRYTPGSNGPVAADRLLARDGRAWLNL
ncbi:MAG: glucose-6-phosphate dehydrogenase [Eubacteriales bacterium]|nr:glucose-6-phosphate dehydrogenase [Eubacteriales bacterium]MDD4743792.1 glucose-6-phosphate dehydrogenase [Eubacteriales bacterium]NLO34832.1 glucose-6-phosphate dehydrogenase [Clostridiaceae bacterium]